MTIKIKTPKITLKITDEPTVDFKGYNLRTLPGLPEIIVTAITEAIRLHEQVVKKVETE